MKKKRPLDQEIYLTEYLSGTVSSSFEKESDQRILCWDFSKDLDEKLKMQIELLLNEIVKSIKNQEERQNRYLLPLKCLFCRKLLFLESKNINWEANVWFTERLNISSERYSRSDAVESFSFLDIHSHENRQGLQRYLNLAASDAIWLDGKRFGSDISHDEMVSWIDSLSLDVTAQ